MKKIFIISLIILPIISYAKEIHYKAEDEYLLVVSENSLSFKSRESNLNLKFNKCNKHLHSSFLEKINKILEKADSKKVAGDISFRVDKSHYFSDKSSKINQELRLMSDDVRALIIENHLLKCK